MFDVRDRVLVSDDEPLERRKLLVPEGFRVVHEADARLPRATSTYRHSPRRAAAGTLRISYPWRTRPTIGLAVGVAIWAVVVGWAFWGQPLGWYAAYVALFETAILVLGAGALVHLVNRTTVAIGGDRILVSHGPIPWVRAASIPSASLRSIAVGMRRADLSGDGFVYSVVGETSDDPQRVIVADLPSKEGARFIADVLADRLGLPVPL